MNISKYLDKLIEYGILAFIFLIPWQARVFIKAGQINGGYWEYGTISLYATELILLAVMLAILSKGFLYFKKNDFSFTDVDWRKPAVAVLVLIVWAGLSILWSINREIAFEHWVMLVEAGVVFLLVISGAVSKNKITNVFLAAAGLQAAIALGQFFWQSIPASTWLGVASQQAATLGASVIETADGRFLRAYGTFPHPNILGGFLAIALIFIIDKMMRSKSQESRVKESALYTLISFGLLATFSRSAILAFVLFTAFYLAFNHSSRDAINRVSTLLIAFLLCLASFFALYPDLVLSRLDSGNRLAQKSEAERGNYLGQSWQIIKQNPILGVGLGNYGLAVYQQIDSSQPAWYYQPVHNVPLLIFAELGIIGFFLFPFSFPLFLKKLKRKILITAIFLPPLLVISFFDHYLWSLYPGLLMGAVYLGLVFSWLRPQARYNL